MQRHELCAEWCVTDLRDVMSQSHQFLLAQSSNWLCMFVLLAQWSLFVVRIALFFFKWYGHLLEIILWTPPSYGSWTHRTADLENKLRWKHILHWFIHRFILNVDYIGSLWEGWIFHIEGDSRYFAFAFCVWKVCPRALIKICSFSSKLLGILETAFFSSCDTTQISCTAFNIIQDRLCFLYDQLSTHQA